MEASSKTRYRIALIVAIALDAVQFGLFPIFGEGFASPANDVLDFFAFVFFWWLIGWHLTLLPSLFIKVIPVIDLAPTWTLSILIATKTRKEPVTVTPTPPPLLSQSENDPHTLEVKTIAPTPTPSSPGWMHWRWPIVVVISMLILSITSFCLWKSCSLLPGFRLNTKLTTEFIASIPEVHSAGMGRLELATAEATETFSQSQTTDAWGMYLGTTYVEMRVPVTYRYHLELQDAWQLYTDKDVCIVKAPIIRPTLPPAIHTDRIDRLSENGWARFNKEDEMEKLEKTVTPTLEIYAKDRRHIKFAREECRKTVGNFVKAFLLKTTNQDAGKYKQIIVIFADESLDSVKNMPPTIQLHPGL